MKTCATVFTIGWGAALAFGWIALAAPPEEPTTLQTLNIVLAALGAGAGLWAWVRIRRGDC
ncbi:MULTISPECIES: hypothetical protein [Thioclava]|uniref:Uncharacterized protein n=1 Tax=Thioclava nitratireducens TaxID=1915078 RepID=A0ABM6ICL5_9RHOB|nr:MULTISPECIES: hypothetical protein [Thioclava]AQS46423.1 hypothetical protein BMG03_00405 [Thioclava nitratireducens]OWY02412.1 hypothetical protein B6V76_13405 [Thioclava sp. IC9]OWY02513.1 hypothetical protein B6V75_11530 [Thioclava sp. F1Mire-8]OWY08175.1 hypothetical protein B6V74_13560 [Thioclava sp. F42-5]OWY12949.1 hypothetical protein B6V72_09070 [Thioclava sp. F34-6]